MVKKLAADPSLFRRYHKHQEKWEYIEDPTYSRSIGSQPSCGSILCCNLHQRLICHGQHLTHSCEQYKKKTDFNINKKLNQLSKAA